MNLSTPLTKAFQTVPQQGPFSGSFAYNFATNPLPDGFIAAGDGGAISSKVLTVIPFCDGPAGTLFSMRVLYWNTFGPDQGTRILIAVPLIEVLCSVSNVAGPAFDPLFNSSQHLCDQITLTSGSLGLDGAIYGGVAGSDVPTMVQVEIQGARLVSFDFQAVDGNGQPLLNYCTMNAFWAKCE